MDERKKDIKELKIIFIGIVISSLLAAFFYFTDYVDIKFYVPYAVLCIIVGSYYLIDGIRSIIRIKNE